MLTFRDAGVVEGGVRSWNDYFAGARLFRVFGFVREVRAWYDVFALSEGEAVNAVTDGVLWFLLDVVQEVDGVVSGL